MDIEQFKFVEFDGTPGQNVTVRARTIKTGKPSEWVTANVSLPTSSTPKPPEILDAGFHEKIAGGNGTLWIHARVKPPLSASERGFEPTSNLTYRIEYRPEGDTGEWTEGWPTSAANVSEYDSGDVENLTTCIFCEASVPAFGNYEVRAVAINNAGLSNYTIVDEDATATEFLDSSQEWQQ